MSYGALDLLYIGRGKPTDYGFCVGLSNELLYLPYEYSYGEGEAGACAREVAICFSRSAWIVNTSVICT